MSERLRLDAALVRRALCTGRDRACELIRDGRVLVDGIIRKKPAFSVSEESEIILTEADALFVSRAGDKLERAMGEFSLHAEGVTALDIGASTGGFTQCLLRHGAAKVFAVDVGSDQLAACLREDARVVNLEKTDIRSLTPETLGMRPDFAVADVSFIALSSLLPGIHPLLSENAPLVCLIKPQFEAGKAALTKTGVVKDPKVHARVLTAFCQAAAAAGFAVRGLTWSPVRGSAGNIEFLAHLTRESGPQLLQDDPAAMLALAKQAAERTKA